MLDCLFSAFDRAYTHEELAFPITGVTVQQSDRSYLRPYMAFNMVSSVDGKATTSKGELAGLGSTTDRNLMTRLRSQVDAVLVGGGTLRVDPFIPTIPPDLVEERLGFFSKPQPLGMVVSNSGDLPLDHRFWLAGRDLRVVFLGETASAEAEAALETKAQVYRVRHQSEGMIDLGQMLEIMFNQLGIKRLLVEGGPSLNYSLISQGLGDELFLSLSPRLVGGVENSTVITGAGYGMGSDRLPHLKLRSLYRHQDELYLRYQINFQ
jgi:2,5-diamino-6-(ribosylamino)-4(3H)-pyrimidinone 5'-phosphate reductase